MVNIGFHINLTVTQFDKSKDVILDDYVNSDKMYESIDDCAVIADAEMLHGTAKRLLITIDRI